MLEYVFFHKILAEKFATIATQHNIPAQLIEQEPAWEVHLPENINQTTEQKLSDTYDQLFAQDQELFDAENQDNNDQYDAAAIEITLKNGKKTYAHTQQDLLAKILSALSFEEFNQFIEDITDAIENPDERSICQRYRDKESGL